MLIVWRAVCVEGLSIYNFVSVCLMKVSVVVFLSVRRNFKRLVFSDAEFCLWSVGGGGRISTLSLSNESVRGSVRMCRVVSGGRVSGFVFRLSGRKVAGFAVTVAIGILTAGVMLGVDF